MLKKGHKKMIAFTRYLCFTKGPEMSISAADFKQLRHLIEKSCIMTDSLHAVFYHFKRIWVSKFSLGTPIYDVFIVNLPLCYMMMGKKISGVIICAFSGS